MKLIGLLENWAFTGTVMYSSAKFNKCFVTGKESRYAYIIKNCEGHEVEKAVSFSTLINYVDTTSKSELTPGFRRKMERKARINRGIYQLITLIDRDDSIQNGDSLMGRVREMNLSPKQHLFLSDRAKKHEITIAERTWVTCLRSTKHLIQAKELFETRGDDFLATLTKAQQTIVRTYAQ